MQTQGPIFIRFRVCKMCCVVLIYSHGNVLLPFSLRLNCYVCQFCLVTATNSGLSLVTVIDDLICIFDMCISFLYSLWSEILWRAYTSYVVNSQ